jgi:uncharacterized protein
MTKVIVTGAGSGIGKELAKLFLADGSSVLAVSLLDEELSALQAELSHYGKRLDILQMDLGKPSAAQELSSWCEENDWVPDTLVNNAGFACFGEAVDLPVERVAAMVELNVTTLTKTSMIFGSIMKKRGHGAILNVGSTAGMVPATRLAAYCASKSYVNTFTYALAAELKPYGVIVTCLTPGTTQTKFADTGGINAFQGKSMLKNRYKGTGAGSPASVARDAYAALAKGKRRALTGSGAVLAASLSQVIPQHLLPTIVKNA